MVQFQLKYVVLALYQLILLFIRPIFFIKELFSSLSQVLKRQGRLHINVPNLGIITSWSPLPSPSTLSSSSSISNLSSSSLSWSSSSSEDIQQLMNSASFFTPRSSNKCSIKRKMKQRCQRKRIEDYPPPLPSLSSDYPWVLEREYVEGRLILRETRKEQTPVERHDIFEVERQPGRLRLRLIDHVANEDTGNMEQEAEKPSI